MRNLLALLLTACQGSQPFNSVQPSDPAEIEEEQTETPAEDKTVLPTAFTLPYEPQQTLDPLTCPDGMQQTVGSLLYEGLFRLDETLTPQPWLCSDYTRDESGQTYTFTVRSGVSFSDGSALTAADAAATLRRAKSSERYRARLAQVSSISSSGNTLTVTLSAANTSFPALLDIPIVKSGTESKAAPIGTGPYQFSTDGAGDALTRNPDWWRGSAQPLEHIGLSAVSDRDTMLYQFTSHEVQMIVTDLTSTTSVSAIGSVGFQDANTTVLQYLGFNVHHAPFDNADLRRALGLGINRASLVSAFLSGHGTVSQFPVSPVSPLYPKKLETVYAYDSFASAMESAGFATGTASRTYTLLVNEENSFKVSAAEYLAESLSAFDLQLEVKTLPWEEYTAALQSGNFDLYYGEVKLTADWNLSALLHSSGTLNYGRWADPQTDELLARYLHSEDPAVAMQSLCSYLQQQSPILPLCLKSTSVLYQAGVIDGLSPTMAEPLYNLPDCTFHLKNK